MWWDEEAGKWTGDDVPDFEPKKRPDYVPPEGAKAQDAIAGTDPFVMQSDGKAWLFAPAGLEDGPLPTHYEPAESPVRERALRRSSPTRRARSSRRRGTGTNPSRSDVFPYVFTTYRLTEHHTAGGMSRTLPYLAELQPEFFVEVSPAAGRGARAGATAAGRRSSRARAAVEARVLVTERMRPLRLCGGRVVHQIGVPYHWGDEGISTGDSANDLLGVVHGPERAHPGEQGRDLRHPARDGGRAGRSWSSSSRTTAGGPGSSRAGSASTAALRWRRRGGDRRDRSTTTRGGRA